MKERKDEDGGEDWRAGWAKALSMDGSLTPGLGAAHRRVITAFLGHGRQKDCPPSVAAARA